jgi:hypothetical protein
METGATCLDTSDAASLAKSARLLSLLRENRIELMIVTILLYSTGLLEKAVVHASGVCM